MSDRNYESAKEFPLKRQENKAVKLDCHVEAMKLSKDKASLFYKDILTLSGISAEVYDYTLSNRGALEGVIDQYRVTRDADGDIASDPQPAGRRAIHRAPHRPGRSCERRDDEDHPQTPRTEIPMKRAPRKPTFEMLVEKRRLAVVNPETGLRFVISLRDWERCLWAVRVVRHQPPKHRPDTYETAHRIISRERIEDWLGRLVLDPEPQRGLKLELRDWISGEEKTHRRWLRREARLGRLPSCVLPERV